MTVLDRNGQPVITAYNHARNVEKAIFGLLGILQGITADKKLNEHENVPPSPLPNWQRSGDRDTMGRQIQTFEQRKRIGFINCG